MAEIAKINEVAWADLAEVAGVAKASVAKIGASADAPSSERTPTASAELVHWWKMNGASADEEADVGNIGDQTLTCTDVTIEANGNKWGNQSVKVFDGTTGAGIAEIATDMAATPMTISFWVKPTGGSWSPDYADYATFACFQAGGSQISNLPREGWKMGLHSTYWMPGRINFSSGAWSSYAYSGNEDAGGLNLDEWNHVCGTVYVGTWNGSNDGPGVQRLFVNGVEQNRLGGHTATDHQVVAPNTQYSSYVTPIADITTFYMAIGAQPYTATPTLSRYGLCEISDFRIYESSLSDAEIASIWDGGDGDWP